MCPVPCPREATSDQLAAELQPIIAKSLAVGVYAGWKPNTIDFNLIEIGKVMDVSELKLPAWDVPQDYTDLVARLARPCVLVTKEMVDLLKAIVAGSATGFHLYGSLPPTSLALKRSRH